MCRDSPWAELSLGCPCWSSAWLAFTTSFWQDAFGPPNCRFREKTQCVSSGLGKSQIPFSMNEFFGHYYYFYLLPVKVRVKPWSRGNQGQNSYSCHHGKGFLCVFPDVLCSKLAIFIPLDLPYYIWQRFSLESWSWTIIQYPGICL